MPPEAAHAEPPVALAVAAPPTPETAPPAAEELYPPPPAATAVPLPPAPTLNEAPPPLGVPLVGLLPLVPVVPGGSGCGLSKQPAMQLVAAAVQTQLRQLQRRIPVGTE